MENNLNLNFIKKLNPSIDLSNEKSLYLLSHKITSIDDDAFDKLVKLETLVLENNKLTIIKSTWFKCLGNLQFLDLDSNEITRIDDDAFVKLNKLEEINLDSNKLKII